MLQVDSFIKLCLLSYQISYNAWKIPYLYSVYSIQNVYVTFIWVHDSQCSS